MYKTERISIFVVIPQDIIFRKKMYYKYTSLEILMNSYSWNLFYFHSFSLRK